VKQGAVAQTAVVTLAVPSLFNDVLCKRCPHELVADIHDRMPLILSRYDYIRWLSAEPDPRDLMRPFPGDLMRMWPISTRVNKPENDDPSILDPIQVTTDAA
jgi:putative SOS response-associated peptidase YedK